MPRIDVPTIETPRLILRPLEMTDAEAIQRIFPNWAIVRFLSATVPWPYPDDGAATYVRENALPAVEAGREWHWSMRPKSDPECLIGMIALFDKPDKNRAFWLDPTWQRCGLMHEASVAVTDFWFEALGRLILRIPKAVLNDRSRRISVASGMRVVASFEKDYVSGRLPTELWEITREEWRCRKTSRP